MNAPGSHSLLRGLALLAGLAALAFGLSGCSHAATPAPPSPTASPTGELPPAWVQKEVAWQSLAAGDPHPQGCSWTLTRTPRLAFLASFYKSVLQRSSNGVYFLVVRGHFHSPGAPWKGFDRMYLVLQREGHGYLAHGLLTAPITTKELPRMLSYRPVAPVSTSVWGHTLGEGGPAPGGPYQAPNTLVTVYAGDKAAGSPLTAVRSDADGFFSLDLKPGTYTFIMTGKPYTATTATVTGEGSPLAVAVVQLMV
jgi:hypothetical protein